MKRARPSPWSITLRIVMDGEHGYCKYCRTRITPNQRPLSDAERELGWPSIFVWAVGRGQTTKDSEEASSG